MIKIDCLGDVCPVPLIKLKQLEPQLNRGACVMIVTDHSCTCESLLNYCRKKRYPVKVTEPISGVWEVCICSEEDA